MVKSTQLTATLEFTVNGALKTILLNTSTDREQAILERALKRIVHPEHVEVLR